MAGDTNKQRLLALFQEKKISAEELQTLLNSIETRSSYFYKFYLFCINPFQKMAGFQSFFIGLLLLVVMAYCATIAETHYPNLVSFISSAELNRKPKFFEILIELLIQCTILAFSFTFLDDSFRNIK